MNVIIKKRAATKPGEYHLSFPCVFGNTTFESVENIEEKHSKKSDNEALLALCGLYGIDEKTGGDRNIDTIFVAAKSGNSDAVLALGRMYHEGTSFVSKDIETAAELFKYAYSLGNIEALYSLGFLQYCEFDNPEMGISMMQRAASLGSNGAKFHLRILNDEIGRYKPVEFEKIDDKEFSYKKSIVSRGVTLYSINFNSKKAIKKALVEILTELGMKTYSDILHEFRARYLRGKSTFDFDQAKIKAAFQELVEEGTFETANLQDYGVIEDTLYIVRASENIVTHELDWDD